MRSIKTEKPLAEYRTLTDINKLLTGNQFSPVFTETEPEVGRSRIKHWQSSRIHQYFLITNIFKDIANVR